MAWQRKDELGKPGPARLPKIFDKTARRAAIMDSGELISYADAALSNIGRCLTQHRQMPAAGDWIREAAQEAAMLYSLLDEAAKRQPVPRPEPFPDARSGVAAVRSG